MNRRIAILALLSILPIALLFAAPEPLRLVSEMEHVTASSAADGVPFEVVGTLTGFGPSTFESGQFFIRDHTGTTMLSNKLPGVPNGIRPGDLVRASGLITTRGIGIYAKLFRLDLIRHQPSDPTIPVSLGDLSSGKFDGRCVTICGEVSNAFADEVAPAWTYLVLTDGEHSVYAPIVLSRFGLSDSDGLLGARLELTGWSCASSLTGARLHLGRLFTTARDGLRILERPRTDIFDAPPLEDGRQLSPAEIAGLGRRKASGTVIAVGQRDWFLLRTDDGRAIRVDLAKPTVPAYGTAVEAVGSAETDLYHVNLSSAHWRPSPSKPSFRELPPPECIKPTDLMLDEDGQRSFNPRLHGMSVRIRGIVRSLPQREDPNGRLYMDVGGILAPVDFGNVPDALRTLAIGCQIEVCGTCVLESDNWRPNAVFPSIKGFVIVGHSPEDLRIIARPPWWTPMKLLAVIGALVLSLFLISGWNISLRTLAERRGRALNRETIARATSDLKVYERTRLAVELHDSIAQSLTGVSLEIKTAERLCDTDTHGMREHLMMATKSLNSCRQELRNCLWDLRNHALEQKDMDAAIRQTLKPVIGGANLSVRFSAPRQRISDNTAHAILRIIRELATNAVRHGHATDIRVAGCIEQDKLLFSVRDNGCGFVPEALPGPEQGHFGIQGIRERVAAFHGKISLDSSPGHGARVSISIDIPHTRHTKEQTA